MIMRVILYLRQSDSDGAGDRSLSLDSQARVLRADAERHGWRVVAEIRDADLKGHDDQRPGLLELYDRCRAGEVDLVAFWKLDRFARKLRLQETVVDELDQLGVALHSNQEPWVANPLFRQILGAVAEQQVRDISANVRRALRERAERKLHHGRAPFGYVRPGPKSPLVIDPEPAAIVRELFERRAAGEGPASIAADLDRRGIVTAEGHPWPVTSIMRTLGHVAHRGAVRSRDRIVEGCHDPIVSPDLWHAAQRRTGHRRAPRRKATRSWLEGLIEHACGAPMYLIQPYRSKPYADFRCRLAGAGNAGPMMPPCPVSPRSIRVWRAEEMAWEAVCRDLGRVLSPRVVLADARRRYQLLLPAGDAVRKEAHERKRRALARRERAEGLYLSGSRERAWFDVEDALAAAELAAAERALGDFAAPPAEDAIKEQWRRLRGLRDLLDAIEGDDRAPVLRELGVAVVAPCGSPAPRGGNGDGGRITIRYRPELAPFFRGDEPP